MGSLLKYIISKIVINISLIPQINIFFKLFRWHYNIITINKHKNNKLHTWENNTCISLVFI